MRLLKYVLNLLFLSATLLSCHEDAIVAQTEIEAPIAVTAQASVALNNNQRRSFLEYYAPVIFKQAHEYSNDHLGYDWLTNFYFDGDTDLTNNKDNWSTELDAYIDRSQHANWQIRPTLYTSIIEFYDDELDTKSVILLYHVYHAKQRGSIHDWERIEIRIDDVQGSPGTGEEINYVVVTRHGLHNAREYPDEDLNFMETANGKHVMIWQADWDYGLIGTAELRFVEDSWSTINTKNVNDHNADVDINGSGDNNFHYIFTYKEDSETVNYWNAQTLTQSNAAALVSGESQNNTVDFSETKRITYELQDIADIIPTHLSSSDWHKTRQVNLASPVLNEDGSAAITAGTKTFYYEAIDDQDPDEDRDGFIRKHWFWGVYYYGEEGDYFYEELDPQPWQQHVYFAHNGTRGNGTKADELANRGFFLGRGDYSNWLSNGGFDGRWVQLFDD
ncbi:hypothetical protein [Zobellia alginiliquefaciens]|uniref:hypothetical protein n=1 Tax=Zobellia alginiliquefaciens TaxID=3032586 RepID=UPI0023E2FA2E|nr:hypothetical protein [Zobellia alginiliquefaciens]